MPGRHLWRVIGRSRGQWGHGGHWTIIFNGMDFWTKYCFFKDFTGLLIWTRDRWMISYLCDLADVILTSTLRKGNLLKFSTLPLTVFVSTWPSFTLRIHFTSTCKKERLCSIHFQGENSGGRWNSGQSPCEYLVAFILRNWSYPVHNVRGWEFRLKITPIRSDFKYAIVISSLWLSNMLFCFLNRKKYE